VLTPGPVRKREIGTLLKEVINVNIKAEINPALIFGITMRKNAFTLDDPKLIAASSIDEGKLTRVDKTFLITKGITIATCPIKRVVSTEKILKFTKYLIKASPATICGIITGKVVVNSMNFFPQKLYLEVTYATGTPSNIAKREASNPILKLKKNASLNIFIETTFSNHLNENESGGKLRFSFDPKEAINIIKKGPIKNIKTNISIILEK